GLKYLLHPSPLLRRRGLAPTLQTPPCSDEGGGIAPTALLLPLTAASIRYSLSEHAEACARSGRVAAAAGISTQRVLADRGLALADFVRAARVAIAARRGSKHGDAAVGQGEVELHARTADRHTTVLHQRAHRHRLGACIAGLVGTDGLGQRAAAHRSDGVGARGIGGVHATQRAAATDADAIARRRGGA